MTYWQLVIWPSRDAAALTVCPQLMLADSGEIRTFALCDARGQTLHVLAQVAGLFSQRRSPTGVHVCLMDWHTSRARPHVEQPLNLNGALPEDLTHLPRDWQSRSTRWR